MWTIGIVQVDNDVDSGNSIESIAKVRCGYCG